MIKFKYFFIILFLFILFYFSINYSNKFSLPFNFIKDYLFYPVKALPESDDLEISNDMKDSIIENLKKEIDDLKKISNISLVLSDFNYINATIIERNREYWFNTITINKGKKDGIDIDMAVIDSRGLVGRINYVSDNFSTVKLITTNDTKNKISAVISNNDKDIYGIINGYDKDNNYLYLIINKSEEIEKNSLVKTTGMGGVFPSGILIGKVLDTIKKEDGVTNVVRVVPEASIEGERYVSILQRKENTSN